MKRSEVVDLIWKRLAPLGIGSETCEEVLSIVENAGMLPPLRMAAYTDDFWDKTVCAEMDGMDIKVALWEKEESQEKRGNDA
jgi:hypothetical protein